MSADPDRAARALFEIRHGGIADGMWPHLSEVFKEHWRAHEIVAYEIDQGDGPILRLETER